MQKKNSFFSVKWLCESRHFCCLVVFGNWSACLGLHDRSKAAKWISVESICFYHYRSSESSAHCQFNVTSALADRTRSDEWWLAHRCHSYYLLMHYFSVGASSSQLSIFMKCIKRIIAPKMRWLVLHNRTTMWLCRQLCSALMTKYISVLCS